jgi:hypothetical protein
MSKIDWTFPHSNRSEENKAAYRSLISLCMDDPTPPNYTPLGKLNDVHFTLVKLPAGVWAMAMQTIEPRWNRIEFYHNEMDLRLDLPEGLTK